MQLEIKHKEPAKRTLISRNIFKPLKGFKINISKTNVFNRKKKY